MSSLCESKNWTLVYFQSFHVAVPILENAENAQARQHVQQQFLLRFSRERLQQYDALLTRFSNSRHSPSLSTSFLFFGFIPLVFFPTKVSRHLSRLVAHMASNLSMNVHFRAIQESQLMRRNCTVSKKRS